MVFAKDDVLKNDNTPYTVFTPYKNKWIGKLQEKSVRIQPDSLPDRFAGLSFPFPSLAQPGFKRYAIKIPEYDLNNMDGTSHLSVHLRFGTVSIRRIVSQITRNEIFLTN